MIGYFSIGNFLSEKDGIVRKLNADAVERKVVITKRGDSVVTQLCSISTRWGKEPCWFLWITVQHDTMCLLYNSISVWVFLRLLHSGMLRYKWKGSWLIYQPQKVQRAGLDVKYLIISHRSLQDNIVSTWFFPETWYFHCFPFRLRNTHKPSHPPYTHCMHSLSSAHLI